MVVASVIGNVLTLNYQNNANGSATITVDGLSNGQIASTSFVVNVNAVNDSPLAVRASAVAMVLLPV